MLKIKKSKILSRNLHHKKAGAAAENHFSHQVPQTHAVLLVDDDKNQLKLLSALLQKYGYETLTAESASEGLNKLKEKDVELIVCDVSMPQMDGLEFLKCLRHNPKSASIPVVMVSSANETKELELLKAGADIFCSKMDASKILLKQIKLLTN